MNYFTKNDLIKSLVKRISYIELKHNECSVLISEHGARVLGIFPKKESINLLWVNPFIKTLNLKKEWNIGGDRYWISPERMFFYRNPELWKGWFCPEGLDPANYKIISSSRTNCLLSTDVSLTNQLNKQTYTGIINRDISLIKEPINTNLPYCGIQFLDDVTFSTPNLKINSWTLAQIISSGIENPGTVIIPTRSNPKPLSYFTPIPSNRLKIGKNYVAYKIDVEDIYKLAIRPEDIDYERKSKIGYVLKIPDSEDFGFLVKLSDDIPRSQDECFDIARDHPNSEIGVLQSYNSESPDKPLLNYGEIELQLNPFKTIDNASHGKAKHQLIGYIGKKEEILEVIEKYLGIANPFLF